MAQLQASCSGTAQGQLRCEWTAHSKEVLAQEPSPEGPAGDRRRPSADTINSGNSTSRGPWRRLVKYILDPRRMFHRYSLLTLICLFVPGPYYHDAVLSCYKGPVSDAMALTNKQFGMLFAFSSLTGLACGPSGAIIARYGRTRVVLGAGFICALGSLFTVIGFHLKRLYVMIVARFVFWLALYFLLVIQTLFTYSIFKGREMAVAYSLLVTACRLGGVFGYFLSGPLLQKFGLEGSLWCSVALVFSAFASTLLFAFLFRGSDTAQAVRPLLGGDRANAKEFSVRLLREVPLSVTLVVLALAGLYGTVFPFEVVADDLLQQSYQYSPDDAGFLLTFIPGIAVISPLAAPLLGSTVRRKLLSCGTGLLFLVVAQALLFLEISHPHLSFLLMGLGYTVGVCALWTVLPQLVSQSLPDELAKSVEGFTSCLAYSVIAISQFASNLTVGAIKDAASYRWVSVWLASFSVAALMCVAGAGAAFAPLERAASAAESGAAEQEMQESASEQRSEVEVTVHGQLPRSCHEDYYAPGPSSRGRTPSWG